MRELRRINPKGGVKIEHVYRECNANADGTANEAIGGFSLHRHRNCVVVDEDWFVE